VSVDTFRDLPLDYAFLMENLLDMSHKDASDEGSPVDFVMGDGYTLHPTPYTLHPTAYTLHPTAYTLHPTPYTLHPTPYTLHPTPYPSRVIPPSRITGG